MTRKLICETIVLAAVLGSAQLADAAPAAGAMHEPFSATTYPLASTFPAAPNSLNGGQGWNASGTTAANAAGSEWGATGALGGYAGAAAQKTAVAGLTTAATGYLAASGNALRLDGDTAGQNIPRPLGIQTIDSGTTYFSLLMARENDTLRSFNIGFFGPASGVAPAPSFTTERFAVGQIGVAAAGAGFTNGSIGMVFNNVNSATENRVVNAATPIPFGVNQTHLIVGKVDWNAAGNETVTLWVDPANVTTEALAGTPYIQTSNFELTSITAIRPFAGGDATINTIVSPGAIAVYDEFRLGGTWALVTSAAVPVPEPSSLALVAMAGLALAGFRTRK